MHHLAGLVQTLSFVRTRTQTHAGEKMAPCALARDAVASHAPQNMLYSHTQKVRDLDKELIRPFKRLQDGDDSHTHRKKQLVKSRVRK